MKQEIGSKSRFSPTLDELLYPAATSFQDALDHDWKSSFQARLFELLWIAYDDLLADIQAIDLSLVDGRLEDEISENLVCRMQDRMNNLEPYRIAAQVEERASRRSERGSAPTYDIACVLKANKRVMYPLEAKIVRDARGVKAYVSEVKDNFLTGRYAPLSNEGGMLGYLLGIQEDAALERIGTRSNFEFTRYSDFEDRPHWVSNHTRPKSAVLPTLSCHFECHHLLMGFTEQ